MKILVTGAAGFIGMHVSQLLLARGDTVVGLDNLNDYYDPQLKRDRLARLTPNGRFRFVKMDVADRDGMAKLFAAERFDRVVHLAAQAGGLRLDPGTHAASCGGAVADLTPTEFRILARLAAKPGDAVRRRQLVEAAWAHGAIVHDNTLDVYIARLRRKLTVLPGAPEIATVHGVGYSLR